MTDDNSNAPDNRPQTFRDGPLKATIWENERENSTDHNVEFTRSYKDRETGEWKETRSFRQQHLSQLRALCERSFDYIDEQKRSRKQERDAYVQQQQAGLSKDGPAPERSR